MADEQSDKIQVLVAIIQTMKFDKYEADKIFGFFANDVIKTLLLGTEE